MPSATNAFYVQRAPPSLTARSLFTSMGVTAPHRRLILLPLLLLLVVLNGAVSKHLAYQILDVTPLRNPDAFRPDVDADEGILDEAAVSESDLLSASSVHLRLSHRDSLVAASSAPERVLRLRLDRDAARVLTLHRILDAASTGAQPPPPTANVTASRPRRGFSSSVVSGLSQGSGEYFARIGIGTPPKPAYMVLDTGSDIVWLQCAPCRRCYSQSDPIFDPRGSRSYANVPCGAPLCRRLDIAGCNIRRGNCLYQVSYGDGSVTTGELSTETLSFRHGIRVPRVALGCGHDNEGLFVAAAGLLGLGRGSLSFPSQAARRFGRRFSYCLVDRTSAGAPNRSSSVVFGDSAVPRSSAVVYTPMVRNPKVETFYYVELTALSVGGTRVSGVLASDLRLDPTTGKGGVIVDSGTSVTRLARPVYEALRDAFKAGASGLIVATGGFSLFDTCYDLSGKKEVKVPTVVMHLAGGASVALPAANYLIPVDTKGTFCFAFAGTDSGVSIIGNIQQQGFRVVFDGETSRVAFMPQGC